MATFFNATATADLALVVKSVRAHADLETIAADAETDVIEFYTRHFPPANDTVNNFYVGQGYHRGNGVYVALLGFNPDADLMTSEDQVMLKTALKRTIADVLSWRLSKYGESPLLTSVSTQQGVGKSFKEEAKLQFPPNWAYRLKRWDIKQPVYTI